MLAVGLNVIDVIPLPVVMNEPMFTVYFLCCSLLLVISIRSLHTCEYEDIRRLHRPSDRCLKVYIGILVRPPALEET